MASIEWVPILPAAVPGPPSLVAAIPAHAAAPLSFDIAAAALVVIPLWSPVSIVAPFGELSWPQPGGSTRIPLVRHLLHLWQRGDEYEIQFPPGIITGRVVSQSGCAVSVRITTNLTSRPVRCYTHWWVNGRYAGRTHARRRLFRVREDQRLNILAKCVRYGSYDGAAHCPEGLAGELALEWIKTSGAADYLCQYKPSGGEWTTFRRVRDDGRWSYAVRTPQLDDDTEYDFRIVPRDASKNEGSALDFDAQQVIRYPDPVLADVSWDPETSRFTFDAG